MEIKTLARFRLTFSVPKKQRDLVVFEHVAIAPNLVLLCVSSNAGNVYVGDIARDKITALYRLGSSVSALSVMQRSSGAVVALICSAKGPFTIVDTDSGLVAGSYSGVGEIWNHISVHPTADRVITTSVDSSAVVWKLDDHDLVPQQRLNIADRVVLLRAEFNFDGNSILTWIADGRINIWDFPSLRFLRQLSGLTGSDADRFEYPLMSSALSSNGQLLTAVGRLPKLILWDAQNDMDPTLVDLPDTYANLKAMEFIENFTSGPVLLFLSNNGRLMLFDPLTQEEIKMTRSSKSERRYVRLAVQREADRCLIAAVGVDGSLDLLSAVPVKRAIKVPRVSSSVAVDEKPISALPEPHLSEVSRDVLKIETLENILRDFDEFPARYRATIWNHVLKLPRNKEAYRTIVNRGPHPAFEKLEETFDVIDADLLLALKRILWAVCHWCPLFGQVAYLPLLVFPFVKVFRDDPLTCFEVIVTVISNWCHDWFEYYPAPPLLVLADVDLLLAAACPTLLSHFKAKRVTAQVYAWPLLRSLLSEVFTEDEWLRVWDHVVLYREQPAFLPAVVAAYAIVSQNSLLQCEREEDFQRYFRDKNAVPVKALLEMARQLVDGGGGTVKIHDWRRRFKPIPSQTYPVFYNFPRAAVEHHAREQRHLRRLEMDYENQKKVTEEAEAVHGTVLQLEQEMRRRDAIQRAAEIIRRRNIHDEEQRLASERRRLKAMTGELRERELIALEANQRRLNRDKLVLEGGCDDGDDVLRWGAARRMAERRDAAEDARARHHRQLTDGYRQEANALKYSLDLKEARKRLANAVFNSDNKDSSSAT